MVGTASKATWTCEQWTENFHWWWSEKKWRGLSVLIHGLHGWHTHITSLIALVSLSDVQQVVARCQLADDVRFTTCFGRWITLECPPESLMGSTLFYVSAVVFRLSEEVGGLFLQASPRAGIRAAPAGARDSGYDSLHRRLSVLDRLLHTHAVWLQLGLSHQDATRILQNQPTGVRNQPPLWLLKLSRTSFTSQCTQANTN